MAALRSGPMALAVVLAVACTAAPAPAHAQTRLETHGDQSPAIHAGRDATVNIQGISPAQVAELIRAANESATAPLARKIEDLRNCLGIEEVQMPARLRHLRQADLALDRLPQVPTEPLLDRKGVRPTRPMVPARTRSVS